MIVPVGGTLTLDAGATYETGGIVLPDGATLYLNGATLRRSSYGQPLVRAGRDCTIVGGTLDGNRAALGPGGATDRGIDADEGLTVRDVVAHGHHDTGVRLAGGGLVENVESFDNGKDGIYLLNSDGTVRDVKVHGNGRTGLVATTYADGATDPDLSRGVTADGVRAFGNAYNDVNLEEVTGFTLRSVRVDGTVTFKGSPDGTVCDVHAARVSGSEADRASVSRCRLTAGNEALYLTGNSPSVRDVRIDPDGTPSGNLVWFKPPDRRGLLDGVWLESCHNGFAFDVGPGMWGRGLWIAGSVNVRYRWTVPDGTSVSSQAQTVTVDNGVVT